MIFLSPYPTWIGAVGWGVARASAVVKLLHFRFSGYEGGVVVHEQRSRAGSYPYGGKLDLAGAIIIKTVASPPGEHRCLY